MTDNDPYLMPSPTDGDGGNEIRSHIESAGNYDRVVARLNFRWRVIECAHGIQWILQRRASAETYATSRWVGRSYCLGRPKLCAAVAGSTHAKLTRPPPPSSPRCRNGSRRWKGAGAEVTREMRKSSSMAPTKTDRAVKLPVVRELPRRSGKRHATSRWVSRSYCHTREALLRCSTPRPAGRLTRRAMAPDAVGSLERPHGKNSKNKMRNRKIGLHNLRDQNRGSRLGGCFPVGGGRRHSFSRRDRSRPHPPITPLYRPHAHRGRRAVANGSRKNSKK
jgi:hypothetical protein